MACFPRTLVAIATYNEIENLPELVEQVFQHAPDVDVLVIDDNSPDGTGRWCEAEARRNPRLHCLHRPAKLGLGTATLDGIRFALQRGYERLLTMDADFSHHPRFLPALRQRDQDPLLPRADVVVGSRYVAHGRIEGWPWYRRVMSRAINAFARRLLRLHVSDCSGAFRLYRTDMLRTIELDQISSRGYSYLEEILWYLQRAGAAFAEVPIVFVDRQRGQTKINTREAVAALLMILRLARHSRSDRAARGGSDDTQ